MGDLNSLTAGALTMGYFVVAIFFLRFWRQTKEPLFGSFALTFALLGASRLALGLLSEDAEERHYLYGIRLLAFVVLLIGIVRKNLQSERSGSAPPRAVELDRDPEAREASRSAGHGAR